MADQTLTVSNKTWNRAGGVTEVSGDLSSLNAAPDYNDFNTGLNVVFCCFVEQDVAGAPGVNYNNDKSGAVKNGWCNTRAAGAGAGHFTAWGY